MSLFLFIVIERFPHRWRPATGTRTAKLPRRAAIRRSARFGTLVGWPHLKLAHRVVATPEPAFKIIGCTEKAAANLVHKRLKSRHVALSLDVLATMPLRDRVEAQGQATQAILDPNAGNLAPRNKHRMVWPTEQTGVKKAAFVEVSREPSSVSVFGLDVFYPTLAEHFQIWPLGCQPAHDPFNVAFVCPTQGDSGSHWCQALRPQKPVVLAIRRRVHLIPNSVVTQHAAQALQMQRQEAGVLSFRSRFQTYPAVTLVQSRKSRAG